MAALPSALADWEDTASRGLIVLVAIVLARYTWARWGDIQVDCGRELYVPTEILRGKLLYRDIYYSYGPLGPYMGALLIRIFGPHLVAFYLFGIAVAIGCAILLFELGTMLEGRAAGLTAALALLFAGFAPRIFNFAFPYSYAATMGLLLSLLCVWFAIRHLFGRAGYNLLMAGFAASLALLCKLEFGVACYLMLAFVLAMEAMLRRSARPLLHGITICAPGFVLWVAIYGWFFWTLTLAYIVDANWNGLPGTTGQTYVTHLYDLNGQRFIPREMVGLVICAGLSLMLWFFLAKANRGTRNSVLAIFTAIAVAHRFGSVPGTTVIVTEFLVFPSGMFFIGCGFVAYAIYELNQSADRRYLAEAAVGIFALVPALRVFAALKPYDYSIYYAMPLFLVFVITISRCIRRARPTISPDRGWGLVNYLLAVEVVMLALICIPQAKTRPAILETSWGAIRLEPEDSNVARQILAFITEQKLHGREVAVLPEAPMFYALTGTEAPSRWYTLLPGHLSPTGEDVYIADLSQAAPDYILLTARNSTEYGADYFGIDYDQRVYHWIESNYRVAGEFGHFRRDESLSVGQAPLAPLAALLYQRRDPTERNGTGARNRSLK